jgi:mono/diheme cytochrome c family protein
MHVLNRTRTTILKIPSSFPTLRHLLLGALLLMGVAATVQADEHKAAPPFDVKNTFRNICGFCHEDYGRKPGKGPQLMDTKRSDEFMMNRIKHGMPARMAAFGSIFNDDQIRQIIKFIRSLKPGEEPQNPS